LRGKNGGGGGDVSGKRKWAAAAELAVVLLVTVAAFAWGKRVALIERGYIARGGELLILLTPAIYYTGKRRVLNWIAEP